MPHRHDHPHDHAASGPHASGRGIGHGHGHTHDHSRGHGHAHVHAPASFGRAFAIGIGLNIAFILVETAFGFFAHSVALLADAGHNLSDVLGLAIAWGGTVLSRTPPSKRFTYGLRASSILAALLNALLLLVALGAIVLAAVQRLGDPPPVAGPVVSAVAAIGIAVNGVTAWLFARGGRDDINIRAAFLHMAGDALVSAGVVVVGAIIWLTGVAWIDPVTSIVIAALIVWQTWGLLRESVEMSLAAVPRGIDYDAVGAALGAMDGVEGTHDLHIWPMSTTETVLTAHLLMPAGHPGDGFLVAAQAMLHERFAIGHATLQIEVDRSCYCTLEGPRTI